MKQKFSNKWIGSRQPRKQRKYLANAPLHIRHKLVSAHLSKDLRKKYERRNFPLVKGDMVQILTGEFKKKTGKIASVDLKKLRVLVDGIYKSKKDGTKIKVYFSASNLQIQELNLNDKKRIKALERKNESKTKKIDNKEIKTKKLKEKKQNAP